MKPKKKVREKLISAYEAPATYNRICCPVMLHSNAKVQRQGRKDNYHLSPIALRHFVEITPHY